MDTGAKASTDPRMSTFAREFVFEERPSTVPSRFWMPVAKLGITDRSAKLAWPLLSTILLMDIGMAGAAVGAAAADVAVAAVPFPAAGFLARAAGSGAVGAGAAVAAVAAIGGPVFPLGATTVAPGPVNTRFTLMDASGSMMTRAYNLRAVT